MLLAVDIGNSNIKLGVFDGDRLTSKLSVPTLREITAEHLSDILRTRIDAEIDAAIVCSVVPELDDAMTGFVRDRFTLEPRYVANTDDFGLRIHYEPLEDAGADRLVNSFSAAEKYGVPVVVCSLGTATTIDIVNEGRELIGGLIAPGLNALSTALSMSASRLPEVSIEKPETVIQNTTIGSIRSGVVHGYLGMVECLIAAIEREIENEPTVVATGGSASLVAEHSAAIDVVDPDLTLNGLMFLHRRLYA